MTLALQQLNWESIENTALARFQDLLRIDTTNPPGNEIAACHYLQNILQEAGIESQIIEPQPGRGNLIARLRGDGSRDPILLTAHLDVVLAEPEHWQVPPFEGKIVDGYLWGRGTIDMKNMAIYNLTTFLTLHQMGVPLKRDIILCFVADEEAGCTWGMEYLAKNHPELVRAEYALNEVGAFTVHAGKQRLYPIQVAEKGFVWLKMKAKGDPGHGSMPHKNNAVGKLARAIDLIDRKLLPLHVLDVVSGFIGELAKGMGLPSSLILNRLTNPIFSDLLLQKIVPDDQARVLRASLHNTVNPTGLIAGEKVNVVPSEATAILDCRILPGTTPESFLDELRGLVGDTFEFEIIKAAPASTAPIGTPMYNQLVETLERRDPGSKAVPYLTVGFTDSKYLEPLGVKAYGFAPVKLPPELPFAPMFHGHNERLPVDGFKWGVRTHFEGLYDFLQSE